MAIQARPIGAAAILAFAACLGAANLAEAQTPPVTFADDVGPLLHDRCAMCHHPNGSAPFSLLSYADARERATAIAAVTRSRSMPPWKAEPGSGEFLGQKPLSEADIALFQRWVADGRLEGDGGKLQTPTWSDGWQLGNPDLVITLPAPFVVPAGGSDFSRVFVLPIPARTRQYVRGLEFRPGNARVVHHANIRTDRTRGSRELDEADPDVGYRGLILRSANYPDGHFLGWTPGQVAPLLPKGLAWTLEPDTDLVVEVHFVPSGKTEDVQPSIGLFFTSDPPDRTPAMLRLGRQTIDIAAGEREYVTTDSFVLPVDVEVSAVQPHAHYRAKDIRGEATLPDGTVKPLISIKEWDFRWQHVYRYANPFILPKGTVLAMRYTYDNSTANPRNPQLPPQRVHWGQWSTDEMGDLWIQVLPANDRDLSTLTAAFEPKLIAEDLIGYETMLKADPSNVALHDSAGMLYLHQGRAPEAVRHFEQSVALKPASASAHYNLGTAFMAAEQPDRAIAEYRDALRLQPTYALAQNNLANALLRLGQHAEALDYFRKALENDPSNAEFHYNVGSLARWRGEFPEAIARFRDAVRLSPNWALPAASLAALLATAPSAELRNTAEAVRVAKTAVSLTRNADAGVLDILAVAYAADGQLALALATAQAALDLHPPETEAQGIRQRLELYKQKLTIYPGP